MSYSDGFCRAVECQCCCSRPCGGQGQSKESSHIGVCRNRSRCEWKKLPCFAGSSGNLYTSRRLSCSKLAHRRIRILVMSRSFSSSKKFVIQRKSGSVSKLISAAWSLESFPSVVYCGNDSENVHPFNLQRSKGCTQ
jgi:hypothetical protein